MPFAFIKKYSRQLCSSLLVGLLVTACGGHPVIQESQRLSSAGQTEAAVDVLANGLRKDPGDKELRNAYFRSRELFVVQSLSAAERALSAGRGDEASTYARTVLRVDPENPRAKAMLTQVDYSNQRPPRLAQAEALIAKNQTTEAEAIIRAVLAENPSNSNARALLRKLDELAAKKSQVDINAVKSPFSKPITLEFRDAPLRNVFEAISRTAGINFVFDKDVRPEAKVTVFVRNTSIDEVMRIVLTTNQLDRKILNENSVLIYAANASKQREYQELVTRTFYLANTEAKQAQALVKQVVKTKDVFIDEKLNIMIIKDTPEAVRMAERLIQTLDVPDAEVVLELEVLEISRTKLQELGLRFPDQIGYGRLNSPSTTTTTGTTSTTTTNNPTVAEGVIDLSRSSGLVPFVTNPGILLNLKDQDGDSKILANPRIRVRNREKAKIHIGDKLPVFTSTSTANVGVSASVNYLDVGLKLDVQPTIHLDDDVDMNVSLEVSSIVKEVSGPQNSLAYQIGTRTATTVLRLKDGETQVLAGLISNEERSSANRLPGLGRIPLLGRLFSNEGGSANKTEIVLLITPRVVRNVVPPQLSQAAMPSGTEAYIGAPSLSISSELRALEIKGGAASGGPSSPPPVPSPILPPGIVSPLPPGQQPGATPPGGPQNPAEQPRTSTTVSLSAPQQLSSGQEFAVVATVRSPQSIMGGEISFSFDSNMFEQIGNSNSVGNSTVTLATAGKDASAQLRLRVRLGMSGEGIIAASSGKITTESGETALELPPPAVVRVGQRP